MTARPSPDRPEPDDRPPGDSAPPGGGSWNRWYAVVIGWLIVQIILYWLFTQAFS